MAASPPFGTLETPFTQELYAVLTNGSFIGGTSFDPSGNLVVDECLFSGSPIFKFDKNTTTTVNGSTVHESATALGSAAGCGLALGPDMTFYSNTGNGITNFDPTTGALIRTIGAPGNALGIAVDPQTNHLVYVGAACRSSGTCPILDVDPTTGTSTTLITLTGTSFADGIAFDPTGTFLFISTRAPAFDLTVVKRGWSLVQSVPLTSEPDGLSFHASSPKFVVTANTNGTMSRFDFPGDDYTQTPTTSQFASGGFRGDLSVVGPDGCIYVPQEGTRFADGTTSGDNSEVQICGGFSSTTGIPPANPPSCALTNIVAGPPKQLEITVQSAAGLASVQVTDSTNCTVAVPMFSSGDTGALIVTATKTDQTTSAHVALHLTDVNGKTTDCDPLVPGEPLPTASSPSTGPAVGAPAAGGCNLGGPSGPAGASGLALTVVGLAALRRRRQVA